MVVVIVKVKQLNGLLLFSPLFHVLQAFSKVTRFHFILLYLNVAVIPQLSSQFFS